MVIKYMPHLMCLNYVCILLVVLYTGYLLINIFFIVVSLNT